MILGKILKVNINLSILIYVIKKERKEERDNRNRERQEEKSRIQSFKKNYEKVQNQSISVNRSSEHFLLICSFKFLMKINRGR